MTQIEKIMSIYYGENRLPYKDEDRQIHYPIVGGDLFIGENNVTTLRFYVDEIGGNQFTWVAVLKMPDGSTAYKPLEEVSEEGYVDLDISNIYTNQVGAVFISLRGYTTDDTLITQEDGVWYVHGNPTVLTTGVVKIMVNYAPQVLGMGGELTYNQYQLILALLSTKIGYPTEVVRVNELPEQGLDNYIYVVQENDTLHNVYIWNGKTQEYVFIGSNEIDLGAYYTKEEGEEFEEEILDRVETVESQVQSVASGAPSGSYATLSDLETAHPTGDNHIYLVLADGNWYYWNSANSEWTSGGVYLSTGDAVPETRKVGNNTLESDITNDDLRNSINYYLTNLFTNGDFSQAGAVEGNNTTRTIADGILKVLASAKYGWAGKTFSFNSGDKVYLSIKVKCDISTNRDVVITLLKQSGSQESAYTQWVEDDNTWKRYSGLATIQETGTDFRFQVYDNRSSDFTEIDIDNCIVVNLTNDFGAGYEPTFEEVDSIVQEKGYFSKEEYISLKMLSKNKVSTNEFNRIYENVYDLNSLTDDDILKDCVASKLNWIFTYSSNRATLKKLLKLRAGDEISTPITDVNSRFGYIIYDDNLNYISENDGWQHKLVMENDGYVRLTFETKTLSNYANKFNLVPKQLIKPNSIDPYFIYSNVHKANKFNCPQSFTFFACGHQGNRGYGVGNTIPAILGAKKTNFFAVEGDVRKNTSGEYFMYHSVNLIDSAIYYTDVAVDCEGYQVYKDGEGNYYFYDVGNSQLYTYDYENKVYIESEIDISTLSQVLFSQIYVDNNSVAFLKRIDTNYAFPYLRGKYKDKGVLTFEEWLLLCKKIGLKCLIDRKIDSPTQELYQDLASIVTNAGMNDNVYWICSTVTIANWIRNVAPNAKLIFDFGETFPSANDNADIVALKITNINDSLIVDAQAGKINNTHVIQKANVQSWLENGIMVGAWNYLSNSQTKENMADEIERLIDIGASFFVWDIYSPYDLMNERYNLYEINNVEKIK